MKNLLVSLILCIFCLPAITVFSQQAATISGYLRGMEGDTLRLTYWEDAVSESRYARIFPSTELKTVVGTDGTFTFTIPMKRPIQYISLVSDRTKPSWEERGQLRDGELRDVSRSMDRPVVNLEHYLVEPGDEIRVQLFLGTVSFFGQGAAKFSCQYALEYLPEALETFLVTQGDTASIRYGITVSDRMQRNSMQVLEKYREQLSPLAFEVFVADIAGKTRYSTYVSGSGFNLADSVKRNTILSFYRKHLLGKQQPSQMKDISEEAKGLSRYYAMYLNRKFRAEHEYVFRIHNNDKPMDRTQLSQKQIDAALALEPGLLRDKLLTLNSNDMLLVVDQASLEGFLAKVLPAMQDPALRAIVQRFRDDFSRGELAYDFNMEDVDGNTVRLSDFRGKVVFVDMWFTGCSACKYVATALRDEVEPHFEDNDNVVFLSISIDKDKRMWMNSITKDAERDPALSYQWPGAHYSGDKTIYLRTKNGSEDPFIKKYVTLGYPTLMLIDQEGKIYSFAAQRPDGGREQLLIDQINEVLKRSVIPIPFSLF